MGLVTVQDAKNKKDLQFFSMVNRTYTSTIKKPGLSLVNNGYSPNNHVKKPCFYVSPS